MNTMDAMRFVFNREPISQAGRRGFDPRLPLFQSNNLEFLFRVSTPKLPPTKGSLQLTSAELSFSTASIFAANEVAV